MNTRTKIAIDEPPLNGQLENASLMVFIAIVDVSYHLQLWLTTTRRLKIWIKDIPEVCHFASWLGAMINPQRLELHLSIANRLIQTQANGPEEMYWPLNINKGTSGIL